VRLTPVEEGALLVLGRGLVVASNGGAEPVSMREYRESAQT